MNQQQIEIAQKKEDREFILIVDENNNEVGAADRAVMRKFNLFHRCTYIFVFQRDSGKLFIHKRTAIKRVFPSFWDVAFGGLVQYGESFEGTAYREVEEESGIKFDKLEEGQTFSYESDSVKVWGKIYIAYHDGDVSDFKPQKEEVEFMELKSLEEIQEMINNNEQFCPDTLVALKLIMNAKKGIDQ